MSPNPRSMVVQSSGGEELLALARSKAEGDRQQLLAIPTETLAAAVSSLSPRARAEFLERSERGPELVPHLPEAVFTSAVLATGIEHSAWLLESATPEQRVAALDLDCWRSNRPLPERFFEWVDALIDAGPELLVRAFDELDLELWILLFQRMARFRFLPPGEWAEVPTLDGLIGIEAQSSEDEERVRQVLGAAFTESPEHYWRFVIGTMNESTLQCQEEAAAKQRSRILELGFPERGRAMEVYRPLPLDEVPLPPGGAVAAGPGPREEGTGTPAPLAGTMIGDALARLAPDRAAAVFADILVVANFLAVADELPLAEPGSVEASLEKAIRGIEQGLVGVSEARGRSPADVLASVTPLRLFRAGATLEGSLRPPKSLAELEREEDADDWAVPSEVIDEADRVLSEDGSLESASTCRR